MERGFAREDYYRVLQVDPIAHPEVVRAAYRTLLRVLGKHPDLGGDEAEARTIIDAYRTLSNPERRRAYDQWLAAHSGSPRLDPALPAEAASWIRVALPEYRDAPNAPFAGRFDLVLDGPAPHADRLYVKGFSSISRANWPTIFTLCRAVGVGRTGLIPSTDTILFVVGQVQELDAFLGESVRYSAQWAWNRCLVAVCTLMPKHVHTGRIVLIPNALRQLRAAC